MNGGGALRIQYLGAKLHSVREAMNRLVVPRDDVDMNAILFMLNKTFFAGAIPFGQSAAFGWLPAGMMHEGETVWTRSKGVRIWMHPFRVHPRDREPSVERPYARFEARIAILLHELCHAFVMSYARRDDAESWEFDVGKGGHGHVWQCLAMAIEDLVEKVMGLSLDLDRFHSLYLDKALRGRKTEKCEVERYEFEKTRSGQGRGS